MATWTNIKLTTEGQIMHARALSNQTKLQVLRVVGATGTVSGPTAKDLSGHKIEADLISVAQDDTNCVVKFQFTNNDLLEDIIIKEIGFFVRDDFGKTVLFSYMTDSNPETLPRGNAGEDEVVFEYMSAFGYADSANVILRPTINNGVNEETVNEIVRSAFANNDKLNNLNFLPLTGGTVTGDTKFNENISAKNLKFFNREKEATISISDDNRMQIGDNRLDSIIINSSNIPKWNNGTKAVDLATKEDVDSIYSYSNNNFVRKTGDTINGTVSLIQDSKIIFENAQNGIQLNINGDNKNRAFIRQGGSEQRGYNLDIGGGNIKAVSLISKDRPIWYRPSNTEEKWLPEASDNGSAWKHEPLALLSDLANLNLSALASASGIQRWISPEDPTKWYICLGPAFGNFTIQSFEVNFEREKIGRTHKRWWNHDYVVKAGERYKNIDLLVEVDVTYVLAHAIPETDNENTPPPDVTVSWAPRKWNTPDNPDRRRKILLTSNSSNTGACRVIVYGFKPMT